MAEFLTPAQSETNKTPQTFGLIMLKPDALQSVFDPLLVATFEGDVQPVFQRPGCDFVDELDKVTLCGQYYRDLAAVPYGRTLLNVFYDDLRNKRYFPMISEYYRSRVAFLLLGHNGSEEEMALFLTKVKGQAETFDECGELVTAARGVRGALQIPYRHYSREAGSMLSDEEYRRAFSPVVHNSIHVCDTPQEVATAMTYLFTRHDFSELEGQGYPVVDFVKTHQE
ncbi:MAG: hypothetical protein ACREGD_00060 [Candidatus Saccharimonadales bacterium]